jgi:hypothetical protein
MPVQWGLNGGFDPGSCGGLGGGRSEGISEHQGRGKEWLGFQEWSQREKSRKGQAKG